MCAFCKRDCGQDAHSHAAKCEWLFKVDRRTGYFQPAAVIAKAQRLSKIDATRTAIVEALGERADRAQALEIVMGKVEGMLRRNFNISRDDVTRDLPWPQQR
jgi:hypothetical protein